MSVTTSASNRYSEPIADAVRWAEEIMAEIDRRWTAKM
jgi:hypothetical protein